MITEGFVLQWIAFQYVSGIPRCKYRSIPASSNDPHCPATLATHQEKCRVPATKHFKKATRTPRRTLTIDQVRKMNLHRHSITSYIEHAYCRLFPINLLITLCYYNQATRISSVAALRLPFVNLRARASLSLGSFEPFSATVAPIARFSIPHVAHPTHSLGLRVGVLCE